MLVNGKPVKLKSVNQHEHSPNSGRTVSLEEIESELILKKQLNIKAIRTAHYPNADAPFADIAGTRYPTPA
jgi:beta-galactosidase/beta-glucuronidase